MILTKKRQKISGLLSTKIGKYEYLTGEEIVISDQKEEQNKQIYFSPLGKALEKQKAATEDQDKNRIKAIEKKHQFEYNEIIKNDFSINRDSEKDF